MMGFQGSQSPETLVQPPFAPTKPDFLNKFPNTSLGKNGLKMTTYIPMI
jgi:hypothetical protein